MDPPRPVDLPEHLVEALFARVWPKADGERTAELERLAAEHPAHAAALRGVFADLASTERLLAGAFAGAAGPVPPQLADYAIERELGRGGMGIVYLATQRRLGRRVALKVVNAAASGAESQLERFERESRLLARLEHPGIVRVIDAGVAEGVSFYAMDYVDGAPLSAVIAAVRRHGLAGASGATIAAAVIGTLGEGGAATPPAAPVRRYTEAIATLGAEVAEALAFAHAAHVIHRDVKPSNVLVRRDGSAVLTDFGLAHLAGEASLTRSGALAGTPLYASPEQARGAPIDHRSDVFSLGVSLYEALTLVRPFAADDPVGVLAKIQREEATDPRRHNPAIADELAAIVLKAMSKEPAQRYSGAGELAADLRAWLDGRPVRARPPTRLQRLRRWSRREPWKAMALATAVTAATGLAVTSIWFTRRLIDEVDTTRAALALAEANFAKATRAVDEMLTRVGERDLADVPQMELVRRDLLQRAVEFYRDFTATRSGDAGVLFQSAAARVRLAQIHGMLDRQQAAIDEAGAAIEELDALLRAVPGDVRVVLERADAQLIAAIARRRLGEVETVESACDGLLTALQDLRVPAASELRRQRLIAQACYELAVLLVQRDSARSRALYERAVTGFASLAQELPTDPAIAATLANARITLCRLAQNAAETDAAERYLQQAEAGLEHAPESTRVRVLRPLVHATRALLYKNTGRLALAAAESSKAVALHAALAADFSRTPLFRYFLANERTNLGNIERHRGEIDASLAATREAIAGYDVLVAAHPERAEYRSALALALCNLASTLAGIGTEDGRHEARNLLDRAVPLAEQLYREDPGNADHVRILTNGLVEMAQAAADDGDHERALRLCERATAAWDETVARHPQQAWLQDQQAWVQRETATHWLALGKPAQAVALVDRSLATLRGGLEREPRDATRRRYLRYGLTTRAEASAALGEHRAATLALTELARTSDSIEDGRAAAQLAVSLASTAPAAERDAYLTAAVAGIEAAIELGDTDAAGLGSDPRFAALRAFPAFTELLRRRGG